VETSRREIIIIICWMEKTSIPTTSLHYISNTWKKLQSTLQPKIQKQMHSTTTTKKAPTTHRTKAVPRLETPDG
jgi:hypothetical protein